MGLNYLTLDRAALGLSGGEGQRLRLASQIGSELTGVVYVLDEPSIGLNQRDNNEAAGLHFDEIIVKWCSTGATLGCGQDHQPTRAAEQQRQDHARARSR